MAISYHNIDGSTATQVELIAVEQGVEQVNSIMITNKASATATISLFLQDDPASGSTSTYRFFVNFSLPIATTLILDDKNILSFDNGVYGLYIRCGSSDELDVIIG